MTRFYIRVLLLILLTFVIGIFIFLLLLGGLEKHYFRPSFAAEMKNLGEDLEWRLQDKTAEEAREELEKLEQSRRLVFHIEVVELGNDPPSELPPSRSLYYLSLIHI